MHVHMHWLSQLTLSMYTHVCLPLNICHKHKHAYNCSTHTHAHTRHWLIHTCTLHSSCMSTLHTALTLSLLACACDCTQTFIRNNPFPPWALVPKWLNSDCFRIVPYPCSLLTWALSKSQHTLHRMLLVMMKPTVMSSMFHGVLAAQVLYHAALPSFKWRRRGRVSTAAWLGRLLLCGEFWWGSTLFSPSLPWW